MREITVYLTILFNVAFVALAQELQVQDDPYFLPRAIKPHNYQVSIDPDIENLTFSGYLVIQAEVINATNQIIFHAASTVTVKNLAIESGSVVLYSTKNIVPDEYERLIIDFGEDLNPGDITIFVEYDGSLDDFLGLYASTSNSGQPILFSRLEPTSARKVFPCWDEPEFKATFDISIIKPNNTVAMSNMDVKSTEYSFKAGFDKVTFATSPIMSTYQIAIVIGDYVTNEVEVNTNGIGENFPLIAYSEPEFVNKTEFALDLAKKALEFYIQYYEVPYPLPKLGLISQPGYGNGLENWGLISFDSETLLIDINDASNWDIVNEATTITHEMSHMWLGDLITIKWWDQLWIQEGFTNVMQMKSLDVAYPTWRVLDQALIRTLHYALQDDASLYSGPLERPAETPAEISDMFRALTYYKGSALTGMIENFVGVENFRLAISNLINENQYGNIDTGDLYSYLEKYIQGNNPGVGLVEVIDTWTKQMGYPVLTVEHGDKPNTYKITQTRYLASLNQTASDDSPFGYRWYIPISYKTSNCISEEILWFPSGEESVTLTLDSDIEWFKLNNDQVGYFRVNYPEDVWIKLMDIVNIEPELLTTADRANLLSDVFALADSGVLSYEIAFQFTAFLRLNEEFVIWETAQIIYHTLNRRLRSTDVINDFRNYIHILIGDHHAKFSWEVNDTPDLLTSFFRSRVQSTAARYHLYDAIQESTAVFKKWLAGYGTENEIKLDPSTIEYIYYFPMMSTTPEEWNQFYNIYLNETDGGQEALMVYGLSSSSNPDILKNYLNLAWDNTTKLSGNYVQILRYVIDNNAGEQIVWDEIRNRWPDIVERYTLEDTWLGETISYVLSKFNTEERLREVEEFFAQYPDAGVGATGRESALASIRNNIQWIDRNLETIRTWLKNFLLFATNL